MRAFWSPSSTGDPCATTTRRPRPAVEPWQRKVATRPGSTRHTWRRIPSFVIPARSASTGQCGISCGSWPWRPRRRRKRRARWRCRRWFWTRTPRHRHGVRVHAREEQRRAGMPLLERHNDKMVWTAFSDSFSVPAICFVSVVNFHNTFLLIDWAIETFIDWLENFYCARSVDWLIDRSKILNVIVQLIDWLFDWLFDRSIDRLTAYFQAVYGSMFLGHGVERCCLPSKFQSSMMPSTFSWMDVFLQRLNFDFTCLFCIALCWFCGIYHFLPTMRNRSGIFLLHFTCFYRTHRSTLP